MKRPLRPDELRVWGVVAATVHPLPGRAAPIPAPAPAEKALETPSRIPPPPAAPPPRPGSPRRGLEAIEPNWRARIAREREPVARLDLHGMDQDRARAALEGFLRRAQDDGYRAALVITGKGVQGDGVLRRRTPEWLAAAHLATIVAGVSEAGRRHGGEGALYVALKRKGRC